MVDMTPLGASTDPNLGQNAGTYNSGLASPITLNTNTYNPSSATGESESPSNNYTPPLSNSISAQLQAKAVAQQIEKDQQNSKAAASSPYGVSPANAGSILGKVFNTATGETGPGTFSSQIATLNHFGSSYLGLGGASEAPTGLFASGGDVANTIASSGGYGLDTSGLAAGNFANLGGDAASSGSFLGNVSLPSGMDASGFGAGTSGAAVGDAATGFTSTTLMGALGDAGIGALEGGLLSKLTGGNALGGSIGGALGGAVGGIIGGIGAVGAAIGATELGAAIGTFIPIPVLGTLLGGAVGGLIGGMFGGSGVPTQAASGGGMLNASGTVDYALGGTKNAGGEVSFPAQASTAFSNMSQSASQALGIKFAPTINFSAGISTKHPGPNGPAFVGVQNQAPNSGQDTGFITYDPTNAKSTQDAMAQALKAAAVDSGYTDTAALDKFIANYGANGSSVGAWTPPASPTIPTANTTFGDFMNSQKGTPNNAVAAPTNPA